MPPRDRNHELETESQRAFGTALPASLVVRALSDDYGIDREVEVFVEGQLTGLTFKVQLKGTDGSGKTRRVKRDSLEYWKSLDVPVLLVSYEAKTGTLRGRWVHSVGADGPDRGGETITVRMDPDISIGDAWAGELPHDLSIIRQLRRGEVPHAIPIRVRLGQFVKGIDSVQLESAIVLASRGGDRPIVIAQENEAALELYVARDVLRASTPLKWSSASLRTPTRLSKSTDPRQLAEEFLVLVAMALAPVSISAARDLVLTASPASLMWRLDAVTEALAPALAGAESADFLFRIATNLELANRLDNDIDGRHQVATPLLLHTRSVSQETFDAYVNAAREGAIVSPGVNAARSALRHHNLGHIYKARGDYRSAVSLLREAVSLDPRYAADANLHRHIGSCEWELCNFAESAAEYRAALDVGYDAQELLPLLADSLMYDGQYQEGLEALSKWEPDSTERDRFGVLRREMLEEVVNRLGVTTQVRRPQSEDDSESSLESPDVDFLLRSTDALDPRLWLRLVSFDEPAESFHPVLIAAMMVEDEAFLWVTALMFALSAEAADEIIQGILAQARFFCNEEFYDAVWEASDEQDAEGRELLRQLVSSTYVAPEAGHPIILRWLNTSSADEWIVYQVEL